MSINSIGSSSSMMYVNFNQSRQNQFQETERPGATSGSMPPPPPPQSQSGNENQLMAQELGVKMAMQQQDTGFNVSQLAEMAEDDSPMSELFTALSENFDEADTDGDGVIKREEAMAFAEENGIDIPAPPTTADSGFNLEQLAEMAEDDSELSELFSALADNFDEADSDGDGLVSREEAMIYAKNNDISFPSPGDKISVTA